MTQSNVLLLDAQGIVVDSIVVDETTPASFINNLISSTTGPFASVTESVVSNTNTKGVGIGWKRGTNGKFTSPIVEEAETVDLVAEVIADERLANLSGSQAAVLEDVLTERIGRPTPKP